MWSGVCVCVKPLAIASSLFSFLSSFASSNNSRLSRCGPSHPICAQFSGIYLYSSRDKFIISFIPVKICSFLLHRDLSDHPSSELYQSRQNRPSCEKMLEQNKPDRLSLFKKKRNGNKRKELIPIRQIDYWNANGCRCSFGGSCFPNETHPSIHPLGGRNYRLSLIRCARCQVSKRWKVPGHRPPSHHQSPLFFFFFFFFVVEKMLNI